MFCQIFLSPQVKQCAVITHKHGIYELPNNLRLMFAPGRTSVPTREKKKEIRKYQESVQTPQNDRPVPRPPTKMKFLPILARIVGKIATEAFPQCIISCENQSQSQIYCDRCSQISTYGGAFLQKQLWLQVVNHPCKKAPSQMLDLALNTPL